MSLFLYELNSTPKPLKNENAKRIYKIENEFKLRSFASPDSEVEVQDPGVKCC